MGKIGAAWRPRAAEEQYDAVVIGSGMGGLSVSSLLAQAGRKVLLLEQHNVVGGCTQTYSRKGFEWSVGLHYIGDVHSERTMTWRLFDCVAGGALKWNVLPPVYNRIAIGDSVYEAGAGADRYAAGMKAYFPREADAIDRYLELIQDANKASGGFFAERVLPRSQGDEVYDEYCSRFRAYSDRTTLDVLSELTDDRELIAVLCGNYGDYGLEPSRSSFGMHAMLFRHYLNGGAYPLGGPAVMAQSIAPIIEEAGGKVLYSAEVDEIILRDGRAAGVRLTNGDEIFAPVVVSNAGAKNTLGKLIPEEARASGDFPELLNQVRSARAAVGLNIGLSGSAAELQLDAANVWSHPGNDFDANIRAHDRDFQAPFPLHFITFPSPRDPGWDERFPGKSTVEMFAFTNFKHFERWQGSRWKKRGAEYEEMKAGIAERLLAELYRFAPRTKGKVEYFEVSTPLSFDHFLRTSRGGFLGLEPTPERFRQRWLRPDTPVPNLYMTGQDITTDGIIGALTAGVLCASSILGRNLMSDIARRKYLNW